jgi:hypothetical protein
VHSGPRGAVPGAQTVGAARSDVSQAEGPLTRAEIICVAPCRATSCDQSKHQSYLAIGLFTQSNRWRVLYDTPHKK